MSQHPMTSQPTALWIEQLAASPGSAFSKRRLR